MYMPWFAVVAVLASADSTVMNACLTSSEAGQRLRRTQMLLKARVELNQCRAEGCPQIVRNDCMRWFLEVDESIPSVLILTRQAGQDLLSAQVTLDQMPVTLDGKPVELDPGQHEVEARLPDGRMKKIQFVAAASEKNRRLLVEFTPETPKFEAPPTDLPEPPTPEAKRPEAAKSTNQTTSPFSLSLLAETRGARFDRAPSPLLGLAGAWRFLYASLSVLFRSPAAQAGLLLKAGARLPLIHERLDLRLSAEATGVIQNRVTPGLGGSVGMSYHLPLQLAAELGAGLTWVPGSPEIIPLTPFFSLALEWRFRPWP